MLQVRNLCVAYNRLRVLHDVGLDLPAGRMLALIGANGAGKSTLLNALSGIVPRESGEIVLDGQARRHDTAYRIARSGLIQVPEGRQVIAPLTVLDNLLLGTMASGGRGGGRARLDYVYSIFPLLAERRGQLAGTMSGGQQQMLAIGRALMGNPRVLLLDEPSLGLAPVIVAEVFAALRKLNDEGMTILLVEQNAKLALETAHLAAVLDHGRIVQAGVAADLARDPRIIDHYFGTAAPADHAAPAGVA